MDSGLSRGPRSDMEFNGPSVRTLRSTYDHEAGSSRQYHWTDDASCRGVDPDHFEARPHFKREEEEERLAYGQSLCGGCKVAEVCIATADAADVFYSIRGGYLPLVLSSPSARALTSSTQVLKPTPKTPDYPSRRRAGKGRPGGRPRRKTCHNGHDNWRVGTGGKRTCLTCLQARNAARYTTAR